MLVEETIVTSGYQEHHLLEPAISRTIQSQIRHEARSKGLDARTYAPIVKALQQIPESDKKTLRIKFDIAHFVVTQRLPFPNYPTLCQLEAKHGIDVGTAYRNQNAGKMFCHFIAESKTEQLVEKLAKAQFFQFSWMVRLTLEILMTKCFSCYGVMWITRMKWSTPI